MDKQELENRCKELEEKNLALENDLDYQCEQNQELCEQIANIETIITNIENKFDRWYDNAIYQMKRLNIYSEEIENILTENSIDFWEELQ